MWARFRYYWVAFFLSRIVPFGLVAYRYEVFTGNATWFDKLSITALAIIVVLCWWTFKDLVSFLKSLGNGTGQRVIKYLTIPFVLLMGCFMVIWVRFGVDKLIFVLSWSFVSNAIATYFWVKHDEIVNPSGVVNNE